MSTCDCCYLVPYNEQGELSNLAMEVSSKDKYAPRKTGVYNIGLQEWKKNAPDGDLGKLS